MTNFGVLLIGLYLLFVGYRGNGQQLTGALGQDAKGFVPWVVAVLVLAGVRRIPQLTKPVDAFLMLAVIAMVLKHEGNIATQLKSVYHSYVPGASSSTQSTQTKGP